MGSQHGKPEVPQGRKYSLRLSQQGDLLQVEVSGGIDAQAVRIAYWRHIAEEAKARGVRKLLVTDRKKLQPATPPELAELAVLFKDEAHHFDRVAVIEPTPEFFPASEYAEIFGQALGINVRVFSNRSEAEHSNRSDAERSVRSGVG